MVLNALQIITVLASLSHAGTNLTSQDFSNPTVIPGSMTVNGVLSGPTINAIAASTTSIQSQVSAVSTSAIAASTNSLQAQFVTVGASTAALQAQFVTVGASTASLQSQLNSVGNSTSSLQSQLNSVGNSTFSLQSQLNSVGNSTSSLQSQFVTVGASTASLQSQFVTVGASTASLQTQIGSLGNSTGTLQATKVNLAGDLMTGPLQVNSTITAYGDIQIGTGTAFVSTFSASGFVTLANLGSAPSARKGRVYFDTTGSGALRVSLDGSTFVPIATGSAGSGLSSVSSNASEFTGDGTSGNPLTLNSSSVTLYGPSIPANAIAAGTLGASVVASSVANSGIAFTSCGSATSSCIISTHLDGRITFMSSATITGSGGGGGSSSGPWTDDGHGVVYVATATNNVVIGSTLTVFGGSGATYSVTTSSGIWMRAGPFQFPDGTQQTTAANNLVLASPSNGNFLLGVANDGTLTTTATTLTAGSSIILTAPNSGKFILGVANDGTLTTAPSP